MAGSKGSNSPPTTRAPHFPLYGNLAFQSADGRSIESAQFNFSPDDLAYIDTHHIHLDHEQRVTASAGASYLWNQTRFSADMLYGSGLRSDLVQADGSTVPNGAHLPSYTQVNLGISRAFQISKVGALTARLDAINVFDHVYEIRDGTGVGVGASQYGPRRAIYFGRITGTVARRPHNDLLDFAQRLLASQHSFARQRRFSADFRVAWLLLRRAYSDRRRTSRRCIDNTDVRSKTMSKETAAQVTVHPVAGRIGAEIRGVHLSGDIDKKQIAAIRQALNDHKVIFFRGQQHLTMPDRRPSRICWANRSRIRRCR